MLGVGVIYAHNQSSMHLCPSKRVISLFAQIIAEYLCRSY